MAPDAQANDLLYVRNVWDVTVYSYPQGQLEGKLKGFYSTSGECVGPNGDVFIVNDGTGKIFEYAHGGKQPLKILESPTVAIYKNARGKPTTYTDSKFQEHYYCAYEGNLFVDGQDRGSNFEFAELPKGGQRVHECHAQPEHRMARRRGVGW